MDEINNRAQKHIGLYSIETGNIYKWNGPDFYLTFKGDYAIESINKIPLINKNIYQVCEGTLK